jgi:hypothetical protein
MLMNSWLFKLTVVRRDPPPLEEEGIFSGLWIAIGYLLNVGMFVVQMKSIIMGNDVLMGPHQWMELVFQSTGVQHRGVSIRFSQSNSFHVHDHR